MNYFENINEVKALIDKLYLHSLELIEEDVTLKMNIEKLTNEGALNLAKTRYTQGSNSVSIAQLPTDDDKEFSAQKTILRSQDENTVQFILEKHGQEIDPIKWFGILVPQTIRTARENYNKAIELSIESANVRQKIVKNFELIRKLKDVKANFEKSEE